MPANRPPAPRGCPLCEGSWCVLGIDPGFTLSTAAMVIPCSYRALQQHLSRHADEFPRRYRRQGSQRRQRILLASEVARIRGYMQWETPTVAQHRAQRA